MFVSDRQCSPCERPMRNLEKVMRARMWEPRMARRGVAAVIRPQEAAAINTTRSPPILSHGNRANSSLETLNVKTRPRFPPSSLTGRWRVLPGSAWNSIPRRTHPEPAQSRFYSSGTSQTWAPHKWAWSSWPRTAGRCPGTASASIFGGEAYEDLKK